MKQVVATADFATASELSDAITSVLDSIGNQIVYVESDGFLHTGKVFLIEETLTDGSKVYNMAIEEG
jgi:hypothetical protein